MEICYRLVDSKNIPIGWNQDSNTLKVNIYEIDEGASFEGRNLDYFMTACRFLNTAVSNGLSTNISVTMPIKIARIKIIKSIEGYVDIGI